MPLLSLYFVLSYFRVFVILFRGELQPEAAHSNLNGILRYAPRPQRGNIEFRYEVVRLWERPADELLAADVSVTPLAMLGRLPEGVSLNNSTPKRKWSARSASGRIGSRSEPTTFARVWFYLEDGLTVVAGRFAERLTQEATPERVKKLLTDALLLTGLRVRRDVAARIFRGVRIMRESDTYLMILDEGQEKHARKTILRIGEELWDPPEEPVKSQLNNITDLDRLDRMILRAVKAANWQEVLDTP